ncbi:MAG: ATP-dependent helicase [Candidatus Omnitrophota bacterium]
MKTYILKDVSSSSAKKIDYKSELNAPQYKVVTEAGGPVLVLAGAGSGKTRTLIYRVAYLLESGIKPEHILLVTFTNKAAREMSSRVELLLGKKPKGFWCGTFHHIANRCLRHYADKLGYTRDFFILDEEDSLQLIKASSEDFKKSFLETRFPKPNIVQSIISFATNSMQTIESVVKEKYSYFEELIPQMERISVQYGKKKKNANSMDYDDLLVNWLKLLTEIKEASERYEGQFTYILVDEYQDTNRLQYEIIKQLSSHHRNILVVGDDAQSIYSFRAAQIRNILDFPEHFKDAKIYKLEINYRSTHKILHLANESIKNNVEQYPKHLTSLTHKGPMPILVRLQDVNQQSCFVAQRALELRDEGINLNDMAVLFRSRYQAAELELELTKRNIPYVIRGGLRFFEQAHIKDVLSYLRILLNPRDEVAWKRTLGLYDGFGKVTIEKVFGELAKHDFSLSMILSSAFDIKLSQRAHTSWRAFTRLMRILEDEPNRNNPSKQITLVVNAGYDKHVLNSFENARDRLEDLDELSNFAHTYGSIKEFLQDITIREGFKGETILEAPREEEYLILSTIHQAKGLEWNTVFIIGLSDGHFPHPKALGSPQALEEERRLFYVAITRAKIHLYLTYPMSHPHSKFGEIILRPSLFLDELPVHTYKPWDVEVE